MSIHGRARVEDLFIKLPIFNIDGATGAFLQSFLLISPVEEILKLLVVLGVVWKNKNFDEENDGIVYTGAAALGFAMIENIFYVLTEGIAVGLIRSVTSVPLHAFTGILMGYYVGIAKLALTRKLTRRNILKGFLIAYTVHAVYDTYALSGTELTLLIIPVAIGTSLFGIIFVNKGKALSVKRWEEISKEEQNLPVQTLPDDASHLESSSKKIWMIVLSRSFFIICLVFWLLLFVGISESATEIKDLIVGGFIITLIPMLIGILLEVSYFRNKHRVPQRKNL